MDNIATDTPLLSRMLITVLAGISKFLQLGWTATAVQVGVRPGVSYSLILLSLLAFLLVPFLEVSLNWVISRIRSQAEGALSV